MAKPRLHSDAVIRTTMLGLARARGADKTICPSEVSRALMGRDEREWRKLSKSVRRVAVELARAGEVVITRKGKPVDPENFKGVYRIKIGGAPIALEGRARTGDRQTSPSATRNSDAIATVLAECLPKGARVLEIASGTGQHMAATLALRPDLHWQPSDPDAGARASQDSYDLGQARSLNIDTTARGWADDLDPVDAVFCANMIHIAPVAALEGLAKGATVLLKTGRVHLYGPFLYGSDSAPSNLDFDASLKSRNASWGVREIDFVKAIFSGVGFGESERRPCPSQNDIWSFGRG